MGQAVKPLSSLQGKKSPDRRFLEVLYAKRNKLLEGVPNWIASALRASQRRRLLALPRNPWPPLVLTANDTDGRGLL
jgi:hypothetical protein